MGPDEILRICVMETEHTMILKNLMKALQEDIMQEKKLRRRFCELAFGGLLYTEMPKSIPEPVMYARELENHPEETKCH